MWSTKRYSLKSKCSKRFHWPAKHPTALQLQPKVGTTTQLKTTANASVLTTPAVSKSKRQQQQQQQRQRTHRLTIPKETIVKKTTICICYNLIED